MKQHHTAILTALTAVAAIALAGCQKASDPPQPTTSSATTSSSPASASVAKPPSALPPSDAAIKPADAAPAPSSGDAQTPTQANPSALSQSQERTTMPHSGQVNNHSVPDTTGEKK